MPKITPTAEQQAIVDAYTAGKHLVINAGAGTGKTATLKLLAAAVPGRSGVYIAYNRALRDDQPVLTPAGWQAIGNLQVGGLAVGADGKAYHVTKVHPRGVRALYEVVFSDGTVVVADEDHLWTTQTITYDARREQWKVRTTRQLADTVHQQHRVPHLAAPVEMPERDLPLDPYLLGALLGDGSFRHRAVLFACVEPELVAQVRATLPDGHTIEPRDADSRGRAWSITAVARGKGHNRVLNALRDLGLHGHGSSSKFVPASYLYASAPQRLAFLQGLMDTDGCACGPQSFFRTTSKQLVEDVTFLAQSLGGVVSVHCVPGGEQGRAAHWQDSYLVNIRLAVPLCPFRLPRKVTAWRPRTRDEQTPRKIVAVRSVPAGSATCISIDAPDHLFLTAGCVPTHNSIAKEAARSFPRNVEARTAHAFAWRVLPREFKERFDRSKGRQPGRVVAQLLRIDPLRVDQSLLLSPTQAARIVLDTVSGFCKSADAEIGRQHVPYLAGVTTAEARGRVRAAVLPLARRAWADLSRPDGTLRFSFEHYLKRWQLSDPKLDVDVLLFDEAQDANPVIASIVERQTHAQRVMVGDASQAIYCQPAGTLVRVPVKVGGRVGSGGPSWSFEERPIESLQVGGRVVSYSDSGQLGAIRKKGCTISGVTRRTWHGPLKSVTTPSGYQSAYTPRPSLRRHARRRPARPVGCLSGSAR